jgi:hypothetical protein
MRRIAPLFLASFVVFAAGCTEEVVVDWYDPCAGACLETEVCIDADIGPACYDQSECWGDICYYEDGSAGCTDIMYDPYNCGACGYFCDGVCAEGMCEAAGYVCEDAGLTTCYDAAGYEYCTDTLTSDMDCGGCGIECVLGCDGAGYCL